MRWKRRCPAGTAETLMSGRPMGRAHGKTLPKMRIGRSRRLPHLLPMLRRGPPRRGDAPARPVQDEGGAQAGGGRPQQEHVRLHGSRHIPGVLRPARPGPHLPGQARRAGMGLLRPGPGDLRDTGVPGREHGREPAELDTLGDFDPVHLAGVHLDRRIGRRLHPLRVVPPIRAEVPIGTCRGRRGR